MEGGIHLDPGPGAGRGLPGEAVWVLSLGAWPGHQQADHQTTVPTRVPLPKAPGWVNGEGAASGDPSEASHGPHQVGEKALAQGSHMQAVI